MRRREYRSGRMWALLLGVTATGLLLPAAAAAATPVWSITRSPNPAAPANGRLEGVTCPTTTTCFAAGTYTDHIGRARPLVGRGTGTEWSFVPAPIPASSSGAATGELRDVACATATRCFAVGSVSDDGDSLLIEKWNGTAWSVGLAGDPPGLQSSILFAVSCPNSTTCFAVGTAFDGSQFHPLVERWNGTSWSLAASPNPVTGVAGTLDGVACTSANACFAAGSYISNTTHTGRTLIERWNGTSWSVVASPNAPGTNNGLLRSISCASTTRCVAVGRTETGMFFDTWRTLIEHWDGTTWSIVASPNVAGEPRDDLVGVACPSVADCTAVGHFDGATAGYVIQRWNGTAWSIVPPPDPGGSTALGLEAVSCPASSSCIAVGSYAFPGRHLTLVDRWDGASWSVVARGGFDSGLRRVACSSPTDCFAVGDAFNGSTGNALIERWDGTRWAMVASPNWIGSARGLSGISCASATMCIAVGHYASGTTTKPVIERWNGSNWFVVASPDPGTERSSLQAVSCPSALTCLAVGQVGDNTLAERWNGSSWSIVASPNPPGVDVLEGIACPTTTNCFAVGSTSIGDFYQTKTLVEQWNGTAWSTVPSPNSADEFTHLDDVACTSATNCFAAGGEYSFSGAFAGTVIEQWNGTTWSLLPAPSPGSSSALSGVACVSATDCTAVGYNGQPDHGAITLVEAWDGTSWSQVSSPNRNGSYYDALTGAACRSTGFCVAVGAATHEVGRTTLVEQNS